MTVLSVSPYTKKPSVLRTLIERSVGMSAGVSSAPAEPAGVSVPQLGAAEVAQIERSLSRVLARAERALSRLDAQQAQQERQTQAQQEQVRRSRLLTPYEESQARTFVLKGSLPPQGVTPGARTNIASWQARSPQGKANAMLAELRDGPMPSPVGVAKRKPNTVTVSEAVRRSLERHRHPFY